MMKVRIFYMDGKDLEVNIAAKDSQRFFDAIGKHQFYFDDRKGRGFWTDVDKIRHMVVEDMPDADRKSTLPDSSDEGNPGIDSSDNCSSKCKDNQGNGTEFDPMRDGCCGTPEETGNLAG